MKYITLEELIKKIESKGYCFNSLKVEDSEASRLHRGELLPAMFKGEMLIKKLTTGETKSIQLECDGSPTDNWNDIRVEWFAYPTELKLTCQF